MVGLVAFVCCDLVVEFVAVVCGELVVEFVAVVCCDLLVEFVALVCGNLVFGVLYLFVRICEFSSLFYRYIFIRNIYLNVIFVK